MMLGLPEETKETFLNGLDWIKNNFPGYSTWVTTLYIAGDDQVDVLGNPSEFERTWKEEDVFREMSMKELAGNDDAELNPNLMVPYVEGQLFGRGQVKWAHDTMNIWEAYQILSEIINDPNFSKKSNLGPDIFLSQISYTNKYTIDDIYNKKFGEDGFHQLSDEDLDTICNFIT